MAEMLNKFSRWKGALESKGLKWNLVKTKVMVSKIGHINAKTSSKEDPCDICGRKTMANAVLCKSCGNRMHGTCTKIKWWQIDIRCRKCNGCHKDLL